MAKHPIPDAALDDRLGFVGTAGSGKTYAAGVGVERLLDKDARVVIVDPLGVWFGLRLMADGKRASPYPVVIFGGERGDLPLNEHAGKLIGETVAGMAESCIVTLTDLQTKAAERRFMLAFLESLYRRASGDSVHIVFDEADLWAPQKTHEPALQNLMEQIVRRGRIRGFVPWLITQRPAVISKDVLSQVDGLVAMKLTASQDRAALGAWIEGQADKHQGKEILASLPAMQPGQGVVWVPGRGVLETVAFPQKRTFDSSRTPKRGEKKKRTADLQPLDIAALKERLATVEAETKANDPKALRTEIARLQAEIRKLSAVRPDIDPATIEAAEQRGYERAAAAQVQFARESARLLEQVGASAEAVMTRIREAIELATKSAQNIPENIRRATQVVQRVPQPKHRLSPKRPPTGNGSDPDRPLGAERRPLAVLAGAHPSGMSEAQWAVASGLKRRGGTWAAYVSRLRAAGRIERQGDAYFATDQGLADLGSSYDPMPAPGPELVAFWTQRIPGAAPMLEHLADRYPRWLTREQLAEDLELAASGGTFSAYLSRLRSPGLIEEDRDKRVRAAASLMEGT